MEIELEVWNHDFHYVLCVCSETFFEFTSIAHQHLTRCGFLLQTRRSDAEILLHRQHTSFIVVSPSTRCLRLRFAGRELWQLDNRPANRAMKWTLCRNWLIELRFLRPTWHKIGHFREVPQANLLAWYGKSKPDTTKAYIFTNQKKCTTTQKTKASDLVASYNIQPGNSEGLILFQRFIKLSLTYLHTYPLTASGLTQGHAMTEHGEDLQDMHITDRNEASIQWS